MSTGHEQPLQPYDLTKQCAHSRIGRQCVYCQGHVDEHRDELGNEWDSEASDGAH